MEFTSIVKCSLVAANASDLSVVNAARVSFNQESQEMGDRERGLVNFLMKNHHGTPFEHNMFTFLVEVPIFVAREQMRHRVGHSYNEWSARYSKMDPKFYIPEYVRTQLGKPGAYSFDALEEGKAHYFREVLKRTCEQSYRRYEAAIEDGVAKEQARYFLHTNTFTKYYWTCNARSLMHFLGLRNHPQAMWEIAQVAQQAEGHFAAAMPETHERYVQHGRQAP